MKNLFKSLVLIGSIGLLGYGLDVLSSVQAQTGIIKGGISATATPAPTASPAPTATAAPTFPSTGNVGAVTVYYTETDNGNSGASKTINWGAGNNQKITTTGSCTLTFTAPTGPATLSLRIVHENSATAYTYTWPAAVKWPSGTIATTTNAANAVDYVTCKYDGTNYNCSGLANFS